MSNHFLARIARVLALAAGLFLVLQPQRSLANRGAASASVLTLAVEGELPPLAAATTWLNSPPLTTPGLRGKVVLVDFWTYSCINCLRTLPYVRAWADKYKDAGLVVIGVHAPEFEFEQDIGNVRKATQDLHVDYPVAIDNDFALWHAFGNRFWPAFYFVDAQGRIRHHQFGEGGYADSERVIRQLLAEAGRPVAGPELVAPREQGIQAAPASTPALSEETYLGAANAHGFASPGGATLDRLRVYEAAPSLRINQWSLKGEWTVGRERAVAGHAGARIAYRFHARDLHLVLGPSADGKPVRFRVLVDGHAPLADHGADTDDQGRGVVEHQRLYQLVRQAATDSKDRLFEIEFLDPGVQAYVFTFG